jgi:CRISPR-associated protein Csm2
MEDGDALTTIRWADDLGQSLAKNRLTTSQIRNFFGEVRQIQLTWDQGPEAAYRRAVLLIPKLGYHAKRARGRAQRGLTELERVLAPALELVAEAPKAQQRTYFMNFVDFFEAILAYHKKHGGRD